MNFKNKCSRKLRKMYEVLICKICYSVLINSSLYLYAVSFGFMSGWRYVEVLRIYLS